MDKPFDYIGYDLAGYPYNRKYPPTGDKSAVNNYGYPNTAREVLFYDFAVQGYDVKFVYNGKIYHLLYERDHAALCDDHYTKEYETFPDPNALIENLVIDGHKLIDIIDKIEDIEPV